MTESSTSKDIRSRAWTFTINNYTPEDESRLQAIECVYIVYGREIAPSTGTHHLQGYIYFSAQRTLSVLKKKIHPSAHFEVAKGNGEQNRTYCTKDGNFFEKGTIPSAGKRTDISEMKKAVRDGATMAELIESSTSYQSIKTAELLMKYQAPPPIRAVRVLWYWGSTGTGKTHLAFQQCPGAWVSGKNLTWFQGYSGQKEIIIDDFRGDFCEFHTLLRILDKYPYQVELKGSSAWLRAETIIITSCHPPDQVYRNRTTEDIEQLMRRITEIRHFDVRYSPSTDI